MRTVRPRGRTFRITQPHGLRASYLGMHSGLYNRSNRIVTDIALVKDRRKPSIRLDQEQAIAVRELDATSHLPPQHGQLMPERGVLCLKSALRRRCEQRQEEPERGARLSPLTLG